MEPGTPVVGAVRRVGLVGCGASKRAEASRARELYTGLLPRWSLEVAEAECDEVFILSAKHHLLGLDEVVEPYDQVLSGRKGEQDDWARVVVAGLEARLGTGPVRLVLYAGKRYAALTRHAPAGWTVEEPMAGLEIGQRLHWLKERRERR